MKKIRILQIVYTLDACGGIENYVMNYYRNIDRNKFQANFRTEDLIPLENLKDKFKVFGAEVKEIDGHDFKQIDNCLKNIPFKTNKINVVIANTVRGKGIPSIENDWEQWYMEYDKTKYESLLEELEQNYGEV